MTKEVLLYLFFGGVAFFLNIGLFILLHEVVGIEVLTSNAISWVICVIFQYITNKLWVFESKTEGLNSLLRQLTSFFSGRVFTLLVEEAIIAIFITWLGFHTLTVKLVAQVIVIVLNYIISKKMVFKDRS